MSKSHHIHVLLCCLVLIQRTGARSWGHNAIGIRLTPRQRLTANASQQYTSVRTAFHRRDENRHQDSYFNDIDGIDDDDVFVDFCSAQTQVEPTIIAVAQPNVNSVASSSAVNRGGAASLSALSPHRPLVFWENMVCGAISRSIAQTVMHPANAMKTILQSYRGATNRPTIVSLAQPKNFKALTRGAGANFLLSVPHGAVNFAVLEFVRHEMSRLVASNPALSKRAENFGPGLDFLSSAISTICCSVVSTPQMMITDNIMAGNYPNLPKAITGLWQSRGISGFYSGWWPGLAGKIPSYALTWTLFQELKVAHARILKRPPKDIENSVMGCLASAAAVCIMIPMDTIKTRLVTQSSMAGSNLVPYKGIVDCAVRIAREEGIRTFYRGLPPRLISVVPMIGIQFGVYEFMKKVMLQRRPAMVDGASTDTFGRNEALEEAIMEVAASPEHPFPAPRFRNSYQNIKDKFKNGKSKKQKSS